MNPAFYTNTVDLIESIEDCYSNQRFSPCLILLYSGIDIMGSLDNDGKANCNSFRRWVERYLIKANQMNCSVAELWGARCGIVHTFSAESESSRKGRSRRVIYAWGAMSADHLTTAAGEVGLQGWVGIHIRDLIDAFRGGIAAFLEDLCQDPERMRRAERAAGNWFTQPDERFHNTVLSIAQIASKRPK